jgi:hypothetical protein
LAVIGGGGTGRSSLKGKHFDGTREVDATADTTALQAAIFEVGHRPRVWNL